MYTNCDCLTREILRELKCYIQMHPVDITALTDVLPKATTFQCTPEVYQIEDNYMEGSGSATIK